MMLLGRRLNPAAAAGLFIVTVNVAAALFVPWLAPYGEADIVGEVWDSPSASALLGNDNLGRDMLSRVLYGARTSVSLALLITIAAFAIGSVLGFAAAVLPKWADVILSRIVDAIMAIPV